MGSCMAHLNYFHISASSLLSLLVVGVGIMQNLKCEMLLCKIDGEMNMQNCGYSAKFWNGEGDGHDWRQRQLPRTRAIFFQRDDTLSMSKTSPAMTRHPLWLVHQNSINISYTSYTFWFYVCLRLRDRDCCSAADGNGSCHGLAPSFFEDRTRCQRQTHHWRWPGNPHSCSKFHKYRVHLPILRLFTFMRSRLLLRDWRQRQLPWTRAVFFRRDDTLPMSKTSMAMTGIDQISAFTKIYAYEIKQDFSKNKFFFCC